MQVWAHRGASGYAPENTIPAFELALAQGAGGVEFDVQLSADGHPVVIHDESLNRTTAGHGDVAELTLAQIQQYDASDDKDGYSGVRVPSLDETLAFLAPTGSHINIELKNSQVDYPGLEQAVLALVERHQIRDRLTISSFNQHSLRRVRQLDATVRLGMLYTDPFYRPWKHAKKLGVQAVHPPLYDATAKLLRKCAERSLGSAIWTVNDADDIQRMARYGANAIITDYPDQAIQALA